VTRSRDQALALQQRGLHDWVALLGSSSEGASSFERGGVIAAVVPACPQRSICNSVAYAGAGELGGVLDELAEVYERAGVRAWTVWTPEFDREAIEALEAAGHALDSSPMAMSLDLAEFELPEIGDLDWDTDVDPADLGRLNDLAYGLPPESAVGPGLASPPPDADLRLYQARVEGQPACVLGTLDHDRQAPQQRRGSATPPADLGFYFVATHPDHRGLGLASRLIAVAIGEAMQRGLETSSLQGSPMGQPVYRRLGYADDFVVHMYERRS
jgi:GNAT superfamily N-acetyltransferase